MSKFSEGWQSQTNAKPGQIVLPLEFREEFPCLAEVLSGLAPQNGDRVPTPPSSIILFADPGEVGFCISPKIGSRVAFGRILDPCKGFSALELALAEGKFSWKEGKRRN